MLKVCHESNFLTFWKHSLCPSIAFLSCWHLLKLQLCHLITFLIWCACFQSLQSIMQVILQCLSCKLLVKVSHFTISINYLLLDINKNQLNHLLIVIAIDCKMQVVGLLSMVLKCKHSTIYHCLLFFMAFILWI
jgi:hypothetical protein